MNAVQPASFLLKQQVGVPRISEQIYTNIYLECTAVCHNTGLQGLVEFTNCRIAVHPNRLNVHWIDGRHSSWRKKHEGKKNVWDLEFKELHTSQSKCDIVPSILICFKYSQLSCLFCGYSLTILFLPLSGKFPELLKNALNAAGCSPNIKCSLIKEKKRKGKNVTECKCVCKSGYAPLRNNSLLSCGLGSENTMMYV